MHATGCKRPADVLRWLRKRILQHSQNNVMTNPYLYVLNQVLQVLDGQAIEVRIRFVHFHGVHFTLCTDVLSQQIDWLSYTDGKIFMYSNDYDEQFTKPKTKKQRRQWNKDKRVTPTESTASNNPSIVAKGSYLATAWILLMCLLALAKQSLHSNGTTHYNIYTQRGRSFV